MVPCLSWQAELSRGCQQSWEGCCIGDITPTLHKDYRVAEEAEESTTMISGSKGIIARCVAHLGHSLDGKQNCFQPPWKG